VTPRSQVPRRSDEGAILILALVFMVSVGMITIGLLSVGNVSLFTTIGLQSQRNVEYGADAALEAAIQSVRYQAPAFPLACQPCDQPCVGSPSTFPPAGKPTFTVNGRSFIVQYCISIAPAYWGRQVSFTACEAANAASCQSTGALIQASVVYSDVKAGCASGATFGCYGAGPWGPGFWGTTLTVLHWNVVAAGA